MRNARILITIILALALAASLSADTRRRAVTPPSAVADGVDALGIGKVNGATVSGSVASIAGTLITLNTGAAAPIKIEAANAKIMAARDGQATIASITPGSRITAFVTVSPLTVVGAPLVAQAITVEAVSDLAITGTVESIDVAGSKFTVLGITIYVDSKTSYGSAMPTFAPITGLSGIAVGQIVSADVTITGSQLVARRVMVAAPVIDTTSLRGKVKSISATSWVITDKANQDITVGINSDTKITGNPVVGDEVQIVAKRDSSGAYVAMIIVKLESSTKRDVEISGYVTSIAADKWTIGGPPGSKAPEFAVKITSSTVIYADPKVGDKVVVTGARDASGVFTATKIEKR